MIINRNISETREADIPGNGARKNGSPSATAGTSSDRNSLKENICSNRSSMDVSTSSYNTLIIHDDNLYSSLMNASLDLGRNHEMNASFDQNGMQEITEIPDDYLNQSHVLKHLAKEIKVPNNRGQSSHRSGSMKLNNAAPPKYEHLMNTGKIERNECHGNHNINRIKNHNENKNNASRSKSQPDLSKYDPTPDGSKRERFSMRFYSRLNTSLENEVALLETLMNENLLLKKQLQSCTLKVAKTQKVSAGGLCPPFPSLNSPGFSWRRKSRTYTECTRS